VLSPREVRALLRQKAWERVVAFQTRNPLHRAHEYALVYGLETLIRKGLNAGAALNPLIGETKGDDVDADTRMKTYEALIETRALGEGDSDQALWGPRKESVPDRVILLGLDIKMFYGGPKEAVMHGIYRQNFGFTNIVIGRKHADAPYHDGTNIWGDFDAQEIFGKLAGDLKIEPIKVGFAAFLRVDRARRPDRRPRGREARLDLREGRPEGPAGRPRGRPAHHASVDVAHPRGGHEAVGPLRRAGRRRLPEVREPEARRPRRAGRGAVGRRLPAPRPRAARASAELRLLRGAHGAPAAGAGVLGRALGDARGVNLLPRRTAPLAVRW
jgi:hypothetical protein